MSGEARGGFGEEWRGGNELHRWAQEGPPGGQDSQGYIGTGVPGCSLVQLTSKSTQGASELRQSKTLRNQNLKLLIYRINKTKTQRCGVTCPGSHSPNRAGATPAELLIPSLALTTGWTCLRLKGESATPRGRCEGRLTGEMVPEENSSLTPRFRYYSSGPGRRVTRKEAGWNLRGIRAYSRTAK